MVEDIIEKLLVNLKSIVESETVIGEPVQTGDTTIIPLTKISLGFGAGGGEGEDKKSGSATGGGANIQPVAIVIVKDGEVTIENLMKKKTDYSKLVNMVPKVVDRFTKKKGSKTEEQGEDEE